MDLRISLLFQILNVAVNACLRTAEFCRYMDVIKMEQLISELGAENIGLVVMTVTNNSAGGQPVSMKSIKEVSAVCKKYQIPLAIGLYEGIDEDYLRYQNGQMEYLASRLDDAGIAYQSPVGGHGVFVDAKAMFPNIPYNEYPAQTLAIELYKEAGIRTCDIGSYMLGTTDSPSFPGFAGTDWIS